MAGDHGEAGGYLPVGNGDAGVLRYGDGAGDAGNKLKGEVVFFQQQGFFAAPTEDERVSAFQTGYGFAFRSQFD